MNKFKTIFHKIRNLPSHIKNAPKAIREYPVAGGTSIGFMGYLTTYAIKMYQLVKYIGVPAGGAYWKGYGFQLVDFPFPTMGTPVESPLPGNVLPIVPGLNSLDEAVYSIFLRRPIIGIPFLIGIIAGIGYGTFKLGKLATKKYRGEI